MCFVQNEWHQILEQLQRAAIAQSGRLYPTAVFARITNIRRYPEMGIDENSY